MRESRTRLVDAIIDRLREKHGLRNEESFERIDLGEDFEHFEEVAEEWESFETEEDHQVSLSAPGTNDEGIIAEIAELEQYRDLARRIRRNAKGDALVKALEQGFLEMGKLGANRKAIIFTESTRTQSYIETILNEAGYQGKIVLFNGSNKDARSLEIFSSWQLV